MKRSVLRVIAVAIALVALVCAMSVTAFAASSTGNKMATMSVSTVYAMPEETVEGVFARFILFT